MATRTDNFRGPIAGAHERGASGVRELQRARIVGAVVELARERDERQLTVTRIVDRAGVSRRTFYELFDACDTCFLAAFEYALELAGERVLPAFRDASGGWAARIRAGLSALLEFLDEHPGLGRLCIVEALNAGPPALTRRAQVVRVLVGAVDEGRMEAGASLRPLPLIAEGVVGGVLAVLYDRLAGPGERRAKPLAELLNPLMGMIVVPFLGAAAASKELARATPGSRRRSRKAERDNPLLGLEMRLTHRTMLVLGAVAGEPLASNRRIGSLAGVQDAGQISKLLARLEHLGLIENVGAGVHRGEPNAWRLTARGDEVDGAIRKQTAGLALGGA